MKILHLITTLERGGAEKQLVVLARNQRILGHCVYAASLKGNFELEQELVGAHINVIDKLRNVSFFKQVFLLRKILKVEHFELIHLHLPRAEILGNLASFGLKVRLFASRHNAEQFFPSAPRFISSLLSRVSLLRIKNVISISKSVESFLTDAREFSKNSFSSVIYYGFDENIGVKHLPKMLERNQVLKRFVIVARLVPQKDLHTALKAFALYRKSKGEGTLEIYGTGNQLDELIQIAQDLQISEFVFFRGRTSEISQILKSSQCLILSSRYEGFGLVLLEAMQAGLPILSARNSAMIEVLGVAHPGLFETQNEFDLAEKMLNINNPEEYSANAVFSHGRLAEFDPQLMARRTLEFYIAAK